MLINEPGQPGPDGPGYPLNTESHPFVFGMVPLVTTMQFGLGV